MMKQSDMVMTRQNGLKCLEILNSEELTFSLGVNGASYSHNSLGRRHANAESPLDIFLPAAQTPETLPSLFLSSPPRLHCLSPSR